MKKCKMADIFCRILICLLFPLNIFAQIQLSESDGEKIANLAKSEMDTADIDKDGITDSLYFNFQSDSIIFLLSSRDFEPLSVAFSPEYCMAHLGAVTGGMYISEFCMRSALIYNYILEKETGKFRWSYYSEETYGNAFNDGSGICQLDLLTGAFKGDWDYFDLELDSLISIPTIIGTFYNTPAYMNEDFAFNMPADSLFSYYKKRMMTEQRIGDVSKMDLLRNIMSMPSPDDVGSFSIEELFVDYGIYMNYDSAFKFNIVQEPRSDVGYTSMLLPVFQNTNCIVFLMAFEYNLDEEKTYVLYYLNKNNLVSDKVSYLVHASQGNSQYLEINKSGRNVSFVIYQEGTDESVIMSHQFLIDLKGDKIIKR